MGGQGVEGSKCHSLLGRVPKREGNCSFLIRCEHIPKDEREWKHDLVDPELQLCSGDRHFEMIG